MKDCQNANDCPVTAALTVIGGRWKPVILWVLCGGHRRFGQLDAQISGISRKILTEQLRELEADGLITRTAYAEIPPRVEYALSAKGESLRPLLKIICDWGTLHVLKPRKASVAATNKKIKIAVKY